MCGPATHLLDILADDLRISDFNVFGYLVDPAVAAEKLGGKACLWGNIDPMLMKNGTKEQVKAACKRALEAMAPCGGFMLGDGANICPGDSAGKHPRLYRSRAGIWGSRGNGATEISGNR